MSQRVTSAARCLLACLLLPAWPLRAQSRMAELIPYPPIKQRVLVPVPMAVLQTCQRRFPAVNADSLATWTVSDTVDMAADRFVEVRFQRFFSDSRWIDTIQYEGYITFRGDGRVDEYAYEILPTKMPFLVRRAVRRRLRHSYPNGSVYLAVATLLPYPHVRHYRSNYEVFLYNPLQNQPPQSFNFRRSGWPVWPHGFR